MLYSLQQAFKQQENIEKKTKLISVFFSFVTKWVSVVGGIDCFINYKTIFNAGKKLRIKTKIFCLSLSLSIFLYLSLYLSLSIRVSLSLRVCVSVSLSVSLVTSQRKIKFILVWYYPFAGSRFILFFLFERSIL